MANAVRFWVDPICPWCWVTARWVNEIASERDLAIVWEPISLFYKNEPAPDSKGYESTRWTLGLLRVMESVRAGEGEEAVGNLYVEYGRRIHHDDTRLWDPVEALRTVGLDDTHAAAADGPVVGRHHPGTDGPGLGARRCRRGDTDHRRSCR